ncbi:unnamed protein product [Symbiodinium natans]|uniref:Uncharacterized protein n=1 Tax=Symbiodinium natans TaxID=878477 RepID=A0A812RGV7_9DINO|nr:unnamed protein product [Symbiodinium natans]
MAWDLEPDAIGLDRFKPWDKFTKFREPSEETSSITPVTAPVTALVDELDAREFRDLRARRKGESRVESRGPLEKPRFQRTEPAREPELSERSLRTLVREACVSLRRPMSEADKLVARLHKEWLETPKQLLSLGSEGWARLALPVGLESELQRRLGLALERAREDKDALKSPARKQTKERTERVDLQEALRRQCGDAWASHLLSALGLQHRDTVDANSLQSALRVLGVPVFSTQAIDSVIRRAAKGAEARGPPKADAVVAAIHGPLRGGRAQEASNVFFDLGGDIHGTLAIQTLRKRMAALELPAVKASPFRILLNGSCLDTRAEKD